MIRIRRVYGSLLPADRDRVEEVKAIFRQHFGSVRAYADKIGDLLDDPFKYGYRTLLLVAESGSRKVTGFSLFLHFPEINASYLDFLAVAGAMRGGGVGGALYEATREYLSELASHGLYMEALPDDPSVVRDPKTLRENGRRLAFYERYGARPVVGTAYETPIGDSPAPYLLFDGLGRSRPPARAEAKAAVRLILTLKYSHLVDEKYINKVVESFADDPVKLRPPRYVREADREAPAAGRLEKAFALSFAEEHRIHHVKERGYVERPARVEVLRRALEATGLFTEVKARHFGETAVRSVHDSDFVSYLKKVCESISGPRPVYPYVFPVRHPERPPKELAIRAGYFCIDTFTPLDRNAYVAARRAVDVALSAAEELLAGRPVSYALCRPPGHHAQRRAFGGFCYFNNAAIAAQRLSREGRVALLDVDFHHGNGAQDIFWNRADVLTVSLHGHPNFAYPYFSGFADEAGEGKGRGFNRNLPLPENAGDDAYLAALEEAMRRIIRFAPDFLVICLGFDTMRGDPTGSFALSTRAMRRIGYRLASLGYPALVVQEGGYSLTNLRRGSVAFFRGMAEGVTHRMLMRPKGKV